MFEVRENEPGYALLNDPVSKTHNRYNTPIDTVAPGDPLYGQSLRINGDEAIGENPNRYKQHGFFFNADNCIACHACEAACSEKNDNPAHIAFRSVGFIEGGTYPEYQRINISMACNHCDDPVCLKGCPTRAYTKFAEYGAVLQDPDICFGCGYCTWVCPYNAPQLDPIKGQVTKCNMCVDRLEVGLKPACVTACLGKALDFGVIENIPEGRSQAETEIPGFPRTDITHPNIRFQQTRSVKREMVRVDSSVVKYHRTDRNQPGERKFEVVVDPKHGFKREWNLRKLRSREDPLVIFTLVTQGVVGAFALMFLGPLLGLPQLSAAAHPVGYPVMLIAMLVLETVALFLSTMHLGKPQRFYRAFNNLRYSPVSREVAGIAVFYNLLGLYTLLTLFPGFLGLPETFVASVHNITGWLALVAGPVALYFMHRIYRIKARPFWNHWQVLTSFYGSMLSLGALTAGLAFAVFEFAAGQDISAMLQLVSMPLIAGLVIEAVGLWRHAADLQAQGGEGAASLYEQSTTFGKTYWLRNAGLTLSMGLGVISGFAGFSAITALGLWAVLAVVMLATALIGRALFYVLVVPTTMPGAFFWKNKGFEEHARQSGLAHMPQLGVVPDAH